MRNKISRAELGFEVIQTHPPAVAFKPHIMPERWMRALGKVHALAHGATDADRITLNAFRGLGIVRIRKITRLTNFTAKRDHKFGCVLAGRRLVLRHRSGNSKEARTIGQFDGLQNRRSRKCGMSFVRSSGGSYRRLWQTAYRRPPAVESISCITNPQKEKWRADRIWAVKLVI